MISDWAREIYRRSGHCVYIFVDIRDGFWAIDMNHDNRVSPDNNNWVWENYWQGDRMALCLDSDYFTYDEAVSRDWKLFFSAFEDGARLLDICTGNGAVGLLALEAAKEQGKSFHVTGADRAEIDPAKFVTSISEALSQITFDGGVDISNLPYADASFDGVSGQYALEYTNIPESLTEIARVLKPQARVRFLLHASEGTIAQGATRELSRIAEFRAAADIFGLAGRAIDAALKQKKMPQPSRAVVEKTSQAEARFRTALQACEGTYEKSDRDFVFGILSTLVNALQAVPHYDEPVIRQQFENIEISLDAHEGRIKALSQSAVDFASCEVIGESLRKLGFEPSQILASKVEGSHIGWIVSAVRS